MWRYQKPGFKALLVAELQKQQQHQQLCDTLLRAEGVTVPAHSCVLSAISPQLSTALSSSSVPPAGQKQLVEFGTMGASSLLHVVRLLYSGEMAGEGESEKQEAVSAATKLGIVGLVEVTGRLGRGGVGTEVGVQTDMVELGEKDVTWRRWEVSDGSTIMWKETLSTGKKDALTQTEEIQASFDPSCQLVPAYETIDMAQFESLGLANNHLVHPYVPIPLICSRDEAQNLQTSSVAGHPDTLWIADSQSYLSSSHQAEARILGGEKGGHKQFEQFCDNIPGFISHFLNMDPEEASQRGRGKRTFRGTGRARQRGGAERQARSPRARRGGMRRGGWMQTVDVQEVGVSRQHKSFLQRCGMPTTMRTGQGGGATGRKLYLKTRHILDLPWSPQKRRGRPKAMDFSLGGPSQISSWMGVGDNKKPEKRSKIQQDTQVPHTAPRPSSHVDSPEHLDCLFDEVMRDTDVRTSSSAPHDQPPPPPQSCSCTVASCGGDSGYPAGSCIHSATEVVATGRANSELVLLEPRADADLKAVLEEFLQSFEQQSGSCVIRKAQEKQDDGRIHSPQHRQEESTSSRSITQTATSCNATKRVKAARKRRRKKRRPLQAKERIHESNPAQSKTSSSSAHQQVSIIRKTYPIRSRSKIPHITDQPLPAKRPKTKTQLHGESPISTMSGTPADDGDPLEENQERCENNAMEEEEVVKRAAKRRAQPEEETEDIGSEVKKKHLEPKALLLVKSSEETAMPASAGDTVYIEETRVIEQNKELTNTNTNTEVSMGRGSEEEEYIDVVGGLESIPDPVSITWSLSSVSEEEEVDEEIDIIGEANLTSISI
ncbi:uncharacterized protein LOC133485264 isoform X1 [Phyllopteryx taeniolatus]|uniref:uncharacterized protein LOC133485264 isoform X1 n=1 Tax=Phyllopteryx taeniolatus TaxID=161469 RepID=UPI002AD2AA1D|nr:uncharacterized protein LOC133485264 isoform X1 [Phyllopteryx taeniolatus]